MALTVGTTAPDFTLTTLGAAGPELFKLSENLGTNLLILFVPMAFTGVCTQEFCEISKSINEYEKLNATVITNKNNIFFIFIFFIFIFFTN